jgi:hypothetical protein
VEGSRAENSIDYFVKVQGSQVCLHEAQTVAGSRAQELAGGGEHVLRNVDGDHPPFGQPLHQLVRKPAGAAACVQDGFIALQLQPRKNLPAPLKLRIGKPMVGGGIPLAGLDWAGTHEWNYLPELSPPIAEKLFAEGVIKRSEGSVFVLKNKADPSVAEKRRGLRMTLI